MLSGSVFGLFKCIFLFHFLPLVCGNLRMMNILQKVYFGFILSATLSYKGEFNGFLATHCQQSKIRNIV